MNRVIIGQILLILCCAVYIVWWYRGFRPGVTVSRVSGLNGVLLGVTAVLGILGVFFSLAEGGTSNPWKVSPVYIIICGIVGYFLLLLVTRYIFNRVVTSELFLIVGWTMLEVTVINKLNADGILGESGFIAMCVVITAAFLISMILYVAYYKMEEMKAFYAALVPLVTEAASMAVLVYIVGV